MPLIEKTVPYKTWIKQSLIEALDRVFTAHVDDLLRKTNVTIDFPVERASYPAIIVRYIEIDINNAGVGHEEVIEINDLDYRFKHYHYAGYVEFAIRTLSAYDADLLADSLVQIIGMGDLMDYTNAFFERIYDADLSEHPKAEYNFININTDTIRPVGASNPTPAPWGSEDDLVYQGGYRVDVSGEFYSLPPDENNSLEYIQRVDQYPYITGVEPIPNPNPQDKTQWNPPLDD